MVIKTNSPTVYEVTPAKSQSQVYFQSSHKKRAVISDNLRQEDYFDMSKFKWINEKLAFYETTLNEDRCIITWSRSRSERDRKAREDILEKICLKLAEEKN
jgi:hypothetical protein